MDNQLVCGRRAQLAAASWSDSLPAVAVRVISAWQRGSLRVSRPPGAGLCSRHAPSPALLGPCLQSMPLLGSMSNESFVLVNGGYEPVVTLQVGTCCTHSRGGMT